MINIGIISKGNGIRRSMQDFYPFFKWKKNMKRENIFFRFYSSHNDEKLFDNDVIIISHRYLRFKTLHEKNHNNNSFILPLIEKLKVKNKRVILFDYSASSGCKYFDLIDFVDLIVKRQLFKNRAFYTEEPYKTIRPYVWEYSLTDLEISKYKESVSKFKSCPSNKLDKLEIGWNTGLVDYRYFPLQRFYPISTERLFNSIYSNPIFEQVQNNEKGINTIFRGQVIEGKKIFSYQRNKLISILKDLNTKYKCYTGPKVSLNQYTKELKNSRICVSPFGWGEICYRDFEAALYGCILIKPSMEHIETWPHIYENQKTYIPIRWDMSDTRKTLIEVIDNYEKYMPTAINLQTRFKTAHNDSNGFIEKIKKICGL